MTFKHFLCEIHNYSDRLLDTDAHKTSHRFQCNVARIIESNGARDKQSC